MSDDHTHHHNAPLSEIDQRVNRLQALLIDKGLINQAAMDELIDTYENKVGPQNGAKVVARA